MIYFPDKTKEVLKMTALAYYSIIAALGFLIGIILAVVKKSHWFAVIGLCAANLINALITIVAWIVAVL